jgi:hypothetical protein
MEGQLRSPYLHNCRQHSKARSQAGSTRRRPSFVPFALARVYGRGRKIAREITEEF